MDGVVVDNEFIKYFATLGVGGVLAAFMFHFYRKDVRVYTDQWRGQSEMLVGVIAENTAALTRLVTVIDALHRRLDHEDTTTRSRPGPDIRQS